MEWLLGWELERSLEAAAAKGKDEEGPSWATVECVEVPPALASGLL